MSLPDGPLIWDLLRSDILVFYFPIEARVDKQVSDEWSLYLPQVSSRGKVWALGVLFVEDDWIKRIALTDTLEVWVLQEQGTVNKSILSSAMSGEVTGIMGEKPWYYNFDTAVIVIYISSASGPLGVKDYVSFLCPKV